MNLLATLVLLASQSTSRGLRPGDFQPWIDRTAPGKTLLVPAGYWNPIIIRKPITLIGQDGAVFFNPPEGIPFLNVQPATITLDGPGAGKVTLINLEVNGRADGHWWSGISGGVAGGGFDSLELLKCRVWAPTYERWHLTCAGGPGISTHDIEHVLVRQSLIAASEGKDDFCGNAPGAAGIDAPPAVVEIYASYVQGATFAEPCMRDYCPDASWMTEVAGPGVRARCLVGGAAGAAPQPWRRFIWTGPDFYSGYFEDCGYGPYGRDFEQTGDCNGRGR